MTKKPARSTTFRSERDLSKPEQEQRVGELFAEAYEQTTGIKLEGNIRGGDPPDRLFFYQGLTIGVELFELGQFYKPRALLSDLTDRVYSEFESRGDSKRYEGIRIDVPILTDIETAEALRTRWQQKGIEIKQKSTFVKELVNLLVENVPSRDAVPKEGRVIPVNPRLYPAVSALTEKIIIRRCPISTTLRTDGKAAPLVIMSSGYHITGSEIEESIENKIAKKVKGGAKWKSAVEHSVLVAHDIPRGRIYEGFVFRREAPKWLRSAASRTHLLQIFDELWFVTPFKFEVDAGGKKIRTKAQRICGRELGQYSGYLAL
jgi:hypothetical protein